MTLTWLMLSGCGPALTGTWQAESGMLLGLELGPEPAVEEGVIPVMHELSLEVSTDGSVVGELTQTVAVAVPDDGAAPEWGEPTSLVGLTGWLQRRTSWQQRFVLEFDAEWDPGTGVPLSDGFWLGCVAEDGSLRCENAGAVTRTSEDRLRTEPWLGAEELPDTAAPGDVVVDLTGFEEVVLSQAAAADSALPEPTTLPTGGGGGGPGDDEPDGPDPTDPGEMVFQVAWGAADLRPVIMNAKPGAWSFGLAETSGCDDCWTGEDCAYGYDGLEFCHPLASNNTTYLAYGATPEAVSEGHTTVFNDPKFAGEVTYYFVHEDGDCYVGGDDPSYYFGHVVGAFCTEVSVEEFSGTGR